VGTVQAVKLPCVTLEGGGTTAGAVLLFDATGVVALEEAAVVVVGVAVVGAAAPKNEEVGLLHCVSAITIAKRTSARPQV